MGAALTLGPSAGCVAWVLPDGMLAGDERRGGLGDALDEALRRADAEPLSAYVKRAPEARICFVWEYDSLRYPPLKAYWRTYGLPNLQVPDSHWVIAMLRAGERPEFAVVRSQTLILAGNLGCADAEPLRFDLENKWSSRPLLLRVSAGP